jgi:hypothetical protein
MTMNKSDPTKGMLHPDIENMTEARNKEKSDAQRFHELTGGCWHEPIFLGSRICNKCGVLFAIGNANEPFDDFDKVNPTYSNSADILNRMKEFCGEEKFEKFLYEIGWFKTTKYLFDCLALLDKAIEFLEQLKKGE